MGRVEFRRPWPPLQAPCACTAARRDEAEGTRSLLCLPYRAAAVAAMWTGVAKTLKARPPLGQRSPPSQCWPQRKGAARGACTLVTWWPLAGAALRPLGGDRRGGTAWLLRAAEMRPKTSGSDTGSLAGGGGEGRASGEREAGEPCGAGGAPVGPQETAAPAGSSLGLSPPADGGGENT